MDTNNTGGWGAVAQTIYYHKNYCYDGGPEFGFARVLTTPYVYNVNNPVPPPADMLRVQFYQSVNTNCGSGRSYPLGNPSGPIVSHGTCEYTSNGQPIEDQVSSFYFNIELNTIYNYEAYLNDGGATFHVKACKASAPTVCAVDTNVPVATFFQADAASMLSGTQWGYVTIANQKSLYQDALGNWVGTITSPSFDPAAVGVVSLQIAQ